MLLDSLYPLITYEIVESSDRIGGRAFTYWFPRDAISAWVWGEYYDVGAMRFPDVCLLYLVFRLFRHLDITEDNGLLIPYYLQGQNCPQRYNGISYVPRPDGPKDPFHFSVSNHGLVPDATVNEGTETILDDAFGYYKHQLRRNFEQGLHALMRVDQFTTRDYIRQVMNYDFYSVQYLETTSSATGRYEQAFTESVLDSFVFDFPDSRPTSWFCIKGGASIITDKLTDRIRHKPLLQTRVTAIEHNPHSASPMTLKLTTPDHPDHPDHPDLHTKSYDAVFATPTLPCLQRIDLSRAGLSRAQTDAIRAIHYDSSTKVAVEFASPWWISLCGISRGGYAATDLPLRTCIYPSYVTEDIRPATLLCSYTFARDAQRIAPLTQDPSQLKSLVLHDLALLHYQSAGLSFAEIKALLAREFMAMHAYDWARDPNASGAFALYGPGQFANYYPELVSPAAGGRLFLVGEACSAHHAWIAGSLDSAYRAL
ncbi:hypothetical protein P170DRAFT_320658, partial [Aspergillus steynii IBT 23096]